MPEARTWVIGTRYHKNDTYRTMIDRGSVKPRIYPGTKDGTPDGEPVFRSREWLAEKRRDMGPYTFSAQILQDPTADNAQGFDEGWLRYWEPQRWTGMNRYILVDPANSKKKTSDYTAMFVIGLGSDRNYYTIDMYRDRWNLTQRTKALMMLHRNYRPIGVGYEKYGKDSDIEHIEGEMERENYRFGITALAGRMNKPDRIRRLVPIYEQGRMYLPRDCVHKDMNGNAVNLTRSFVTEEYLDFPVATHDDMLDAQSRIMDDEMHVAWPEPTKDQSEWMKQLESESRGFMAA